MICRLTRSMSSSVLATGLFALSKLTWTWSVTAEVFGLNNLFVASILLLAVKFDQVKKDDQQAIKVGHKSKGRKEMLSLFVCLFVCFYVPSTARSFRDGTPIYCPLRRTWSSVNTPFPPGIEPRAVTWQSITLPLRHVSHCPIIWWFYWSDGKSVNGRAQPDNHMRF